MGGSNPPRRIIKDHMAFVYILQSQKNGRYYIGSTNDVGKRIRRHLAGEVRSTKNLLPVKLVFSQEFPNLSLARKIEQKLKKYKRRDFLDKIIDEGEIKKLD